MTGHSGWDSIPRDGKIAILCLIGFVIFIMTPILYCFCKCKFGNCCSKKTKSTSSSQKNQNIIYIPETRSPNLDKAIELQVMRIQPELERAMGIDLEARISRKRAREERLQQLAKYSEEKDRQHKKMKVDAFAGLGKLAYKKWKVNENGIVEEVKPLPENYVEMVNIIQEEDIYESLEEIHL
uniref:Uncharacterized protein n=1 Tax=Pilchard orthomyxovirus TaxID=2732827 RepID=A0A6M4AKB2_9ORTO|nr:putative protein S4B [Pilchard orthomyxovirus]QJQ28603.1 putative protein S4B [Pilchard orthomyxovirus]QJQ28613.1 putative protein S4B [Pilchard orthomyxovirus]QJQ28623.1 putative protein S4B [Pilchard orthomyxovirus]QJQ28633.1 putative protein S4B [Pilchard orthomyxovirus]